MNKVKFEDPTGQWTMVLSGCRRHYHLQANFDLLKKRELFAALEAEYEIDRFSRYEEGSVVVFSAREEQTIDLIDNVSHIFISNLSY